MKKPTRYIPLLSTDNEYVWEGNYSAISNIAHKLTLKFLCQRFLNFIVPKYFLKSFHVEYKEHFLKSFHIEYKEHCAFANVRNYQCFFLFWKLAARCETPHVGPFCTK